MADLDRVGQAVARMRNVMEADAVEETMQEGPSSTIVGVEAELERVGGRAAGDAKALGVGIA